MTGDWPLGSVAVDQFLADYWQRRPLLIRQAIPGYQSPIDANELSGLALENSVESRLVFERHPDGPWHVDHGPFSEQRLQSLPVAGWTLLIQAVDHWVPAIELLRRRFEFLPAWRIDDVMASVAPPGSSVGPHFDYYDGFLLQAQGRRRWQLGQRCDANTPTLADTPLSILEDFKPRQEWVLEPGDMLYIPPGLAHWGVAVDDCITLSIGFRAPAESECLMALVERAIDTLPAQRRYVDPALSASVRPGQIPEAAIDALRQMVTRLADDRELLSDCFGALMTEPKYPDPEDVKGAEPEGWRKWLAAGGSLRRHPGARFAFQTGPAGARLYVNGNVLSCGEALAALLCAHPELDLPMLSDWLADQQACRIMDTLWIGGALEARQDD